MRKRIARRLAGLLVVAAFFTGVVGAVTATPAEAGTLHCTHPTQGLHGLGGTAYHTVSHYYAPGNVKIMVDGRYRLSGGPGGYWFTYIETRYLNCGGGWA